MGFVAGLLIAWRLDTGSHSVNDVLPWLTAIIGTLTVEWLVLSTLGEAELTHTAERVDALAARHTEHKEDVGAVRGDLVTVRGDIAALRREVHDMAHMAAAETGRKLLHETAFRYSGRELSIGEVDSAWRDLTMCLRHDYRATNYMDLGDLYNGPTGRNIVEMQAAIRKVYPEIPFQKVMIVDKREELYQGAGKEAMNKHRTAKGIVIKSMERAMLDTPAFAADIKAIGGMKRIDFAVFDRCVVVVWSVDKDRKREGGTVLVEPTEVKHFLAFFEHLSREANAYP